uniref:Phosphatidic acid phosphatase type 2/haloperoxidase domain-containing protein n=1 Tax=Acidianus sulfidivorans JP7 TaxID=619593 RepID=A0A2U9IPL8_9CREN
MKNISKYISIIFHPSISTFLGFLILILGKGYRIYDLLIVTFFFSIFPFLITLILKVTGRISDLFIKERSERFLPILISLIGYVVGIILILPINLISYIAIIYVINTLIILLITIKCKISIHVATIMGMVTSILIVFSNSIETIFPILFLPVIVGWARLNQRAHTFRQVILGGLISFMLTFIELFLFFSYFRTS